MFDACVYWIHWPSMYDHYTEGYIGVSTEFSRRQTVHLSALKNNKHENIHLQRAYDIDPNIIIEPIYIGEEMSCYELEEELRPHRNKGWNINTGGTKPPAYDGRPRAKGGKGPVKPVTSPDGIVFESVIAAAAHYGVDRSTIDNWRKDPTKPWKKRASVKQHTKYDITQHNDALKHPIHTPTGVFESVRAAARSYGVVHGTINYWLKTGREGFYYIKP